MNGIFGVNVEKIIWDGSITRKTGLEILRVESWSWLKLRAGK